MNHQRNRNFDLDAKNPIRSRLQHLWFVEATTQYRGKILTNRSPIVQKIKSFQGISLPYSLEPISFEDLETDNFMQRTLSIPLEFKLDESGFSYTKEKTKTMLNSTTTGLSISSTPITICIRSKPKGSLANYYYFVTNLLKRSKKLHISFNANNAVGTDTVTIKFYGPLGPGTSCIPFRTETLPIILDTIYIGNMDIFLDVPETDLYIQMTSARTNLWTMHLTFEQI